MQALGGRGQGDEFYDFSPFGFLFGLDDEIVRDQTRLCGLRPTRIVFVFSVFVFLCGSGLSRVRLCGRGSFGRAVTAVFIIVSMVEPSFFVCVTS